VAIGVFVKLHAKKTKECIPANDICPQFAEPEICLRASEKAKGLADSLMNKDISIFTN